MRRAQGLKARAVAATRALARAVPGEEAGPVDVTLSGARPFL